MSREAPRGANVQRTARSDKRYSARAVNILYGSCRGHNHNTKPLLELRNAYSTSKSVRTLVPSVVRSSMSTPIKACVRSNTNGSTSCALRAALIPAMIPCAAASSYLLKPCAVTSQVPNTVAWPRDTHPVVPLI